MIVWSCEFPVSPSSTTDDVLRIAKKWLEGSPHHAWTGIMVYSEPDNEISEYEAGGQTVAIARTGDAGATRIGFRHAWTDPKQREWITEIVAGGPPGAVLVSVRVDCNALNPQAQRSRAKKPYIVRQLLEELGGGTDGWLLVSDKPVMLQDHQINEAASILDGTISHRLPAVYVSAGGPPSMWVDPNDLSKWLAGSAHVLAEPSRAFSIALTSRLAGQHPYSGAIAIVWPSGQGAQTRLLARDFGSEREFAVAVTDKVTASLAAAKPSDGLTWAALQSEVARHRIEELKKSGTSKLDEYIREFDVQVAALEGELREEKREVARLRAKIAAVEEASARSHGIVNVGSEAELYPGEALDAVLVALRLGRDGLFEGGRRRTILDGILKENRASSVEPHFTQQVKKAFATRGDLDAENRRILEDLGIEISSDGKHHRIVYQGDARFAFTVAKTSSDHRAGKNMASTILRTIFR